MKVALVVNEFPKISEAFIVRQCQKLDADIITLFFNTKDATNFEINNAKVHSIGSSKSFFQKLKDKFLGIPCRIWSVEEQRKFKKALKQCNTEVVLASFGPNGINVMETCKQLAIPYFVQFLGYDASELMSSEWYRTKIQEVIKGAVGAIVLYNGMEQIFMKEGLDNKNFHVLNIGVPTERFANIKPDFATPRPTQFLAVGRLVEKKSPLNLLRAFLICAKANQEIFLNIVGDGALRGEVEHFIKKEPLIRNKVTLHGFLSQDELLPLYNRSHVFVQHSVTGRDGNREGWPVGIAEACSCGLPVIATRHAGIPEQVLDGQTGFLVEENDFQAMGDRMIQLSRDWSLAKQFGEKAKQHMLQHGDLDNQIEKLKVLLNSAIKINSQ